MVNGPLNGIKILDLTHVWAGPLAVRFLADLGAEVVRVEAPSSRGPRVFPSSPIGGWMGGVPGDEPWNANAAFNKLMRNRQSFCVDMKQHSGRLAFLQLVAVADVVIENFSARAMPSLNLDYDVLREANPNIIYVTMPGFGSTGIYKDRVAFGPTVEAMSGLTYMFGYGRNQPRNTAMALLDPITATHSAAAVVTALRRRQQTSKGCRVELSLHEGGVAYSGPWLIDEQLGNVPCCIGNRHPGMAPHGVYPCDTEQAGESWIAVACANDHQWSALYLLIDAHGMMLNRSWSLSQRITHHDVVDECLSRWTASQNSQQATTRLQQAGVSAGPVNTAADMVADEQAMARNFFVDYEPHGVPMPGNPIKMPELNTHEWTASPDLGADNADILKRWLNYDNRQIQALEEAGVIMNAPPA